jgi:aspartate aminotransferase
MLTECKDKRRFSGVQYRDAGRGAVRVESDLSATLAALARARKVLAGLSEDGRRLSPDMFDERVISLACGDGTRRPHPGVVVSGVDALFDSEESTLENYFYLKRYSALEDALAADFVRRGVPETDASNLVIGSGATQIISSFIQFCTGPEDVILVGAGFYHPLSSWVDLAGRDMRIIGTRAEDGFKITPAALRQWAAARRKTAGRTYLLFFNPTYFGGVYSEEELAGIAEAARELDIFVVEDAIFMGTEFPGRRSSHIASREGMSGRTLTIKGASKALNMANLRVGWACGPKDVTDRLNFVIDTLSGSVPHVIKRMTLAALEAPEGYLAENSAECHARTLLISQLVADVNARLRTKGFSGAQIRVPYATGAGHSLALDFSDFLGLDSPEGRLSDSVDIARFFLTHAHVALAPGLSHGIKQAVLRVAYGSVGVEGTYAFSRGAERRGLADWTAGEKNLLSSGQTGSNPWAKGRLAIENAFLRRMLPALETLLSRNATGLRRS